MCAAKLAQPHLLALNCHSVHAQNTFSAMHAKAQRTLYYGIRVQMQSFVHAVHCVRAVGHPVT